MYQKLPKNIRSNTRTLLTKTNLTTNQFKKEKEPRDNARKNKLKKKYRVKHRPDRRHVFL